MPYRDGLTRKCGIEAMYSTNGDLTGAERRRRIPGLAADPVDRRRPLPATPAPRHEAQSIDIDRVIVWLRQGVPVILLSAALVALAGLGYSLLTKPRFTAMAEIVIDPSNLQVVPDDLYAQNQQRDSQLLEVQSMLGVLVSGNTLARVVADAGLTDDEEFVKSSGFDIASMLGLGNSGSARPAEATALESLATRVKAVREDGSFVVGVSAWTGDPEKSVRIVNSLVGAFQTELAEQQAEGARRSVDNLSVQLAQLKQNVAMAESAVEAFRRTHNLQQTNGELISGQSMAQLNAQTTDAQARVIAAQARYDSLVSTGLAGASTDALQSATMTALRSQYATLKQEYDSAAATLGRLHPTMQELAGQLKAAEDQIAREIARTVAAAKSEIDAATAALTALQVQTAEARGSVAIDDQAQVQLRELQREAESAVAIYQAYLSRTDQLAQRQQIDTTNVRVISPPLLPKKSWPPGPVLAGSGGLVAGLLLGILLAAGLGFFRDYFRMRSRTAR